jgi:phenylacetate-CoA ligase
VSDTELSNPQIKNIEDAIALYLESGLRFTFNRKESLQRTTRGKLKQFQSML